jgi:hypothetical protein
MVVMMMTTMVVRLSKSGRSKQHNRGKQQNLFHAHMIATTVRIWIL